MYANCRIETSVEGEGALVNVKDVIFTQNYVMISLLCINEIIIIMKETIFSEKNIN